MRVEDGFALLELVPHEAARQQEDGGECDGDVFHPPRYRSDEGFAERARGVRCRGVLRPPRLRLLLQSTDMAQEISFISPEFDPGAMNDCEIHFQYATNPSNDQKELPTMNRIARQQRGVARWACLLVVPLLGSPADADAATPAAGDPPASEAAQSTTAAVEPVLGLEDARRAAREHNPELQAALSRVRAQDARAQQAGRFLNPEFALEIENLGVTGDLLDTEVAETKILLIQPFEIGGKRGKRREVGEHRAALLSRERSLLERSVDARVARAFASALAAQELVDLSDELVVASEALVERVVDEARGRRLADVDRTRLTLALNRTRIDRERARTRSAAARIRLAAAMGSDHPISERLAGDLFRVSEPPPLERLLDVVDAAPRMARSEDEVALQHAVVTLQRARRLPDVSVMAGYRRLSEIDADGVVLGLAVPLPLFDRNQSELEAARHDLEGAMRTQRNARLQLRAELALAHEHLSAAFFEVRALEDELLPDAEKALEQAQRAYARREVALRDVLNARSVFYRARTERVKTLEAYHHALADLEELVDAGTGSQL